MKLTLFLSLLILSFSKTYSQWIRPVKGFPNNQDYFGWKTPVGTQFHAGLDIPASIGEPVRALRDGYVIRSTDQADGYKSNCNGGACKWANGEAIVLRHIDNNGAYFYTVYGHFERCSNITENSLVKAGDILGYIYDYCGCRTGACCSAPHLHIGITTQNRGTSTYKRTNVAGYGDTIGIIDDDGWQNPATFLNSNCGAENLPLNFNQTILAGRADKQQKIYIIFNAFNGKIPNSNGIQNFGINNQSPNVTIGSIQILGNDSYLFPITIPANTFSNNRYYDIQFDIKFSDNSVERAYGKQQVWFGDGNFNDNSSSWYQVSRYAKKAETYGFMQRSGSDIFGAGYINYGESAKSIVNAAIKFRLLNNSNPMAGLNGAFSTSPERVEGCNKYYQYFQILNHWGNQLGIPYNLPLGKNTESNISREEVAKMLCLAFAIDNSTNNQYLTLNNIATEPSCNINASSYLGILQSKSLAILNNITAESVSSCVGLGSDWVNKAMLAKLIVNSYEYKYQVNNNMLPNARILGVNAMYNFQVIGNKKEFQSIPSGSALPSNTLPTINMTPGQQKTFAFPDVTIDGQLVSVYWSVDGGTLEQFGASPYFQSVKWTAPSVSAQQTFHLYYYATTAGGYATESITDIVVNPESPNITISSSKTAICTGESIMLSSTNCSGIVTWKSDNVNLGTGTTKTLYPTETRTYYATCKVNNVESLRSNNVTVTVTPKPLVPVVIAYPDTIDIGLSSVLDIDSSPCDGGKGIISWDNGLANGFSQTISPVQTTTYNATCTIKGCASNAVPVQVTVRTDCVLPNLLVSSGSSGISIERIAGTLPMQVEIEGQTHIFTGNSMYLERFPTVSTVYRVQKVTNRCGVGTATGRAYIPVVTPCMNNNPIVTTSKDAICTGESTTFDATGCIGTVKWYNTRDKEYGEKFLGTGTSINTDILTQTTGFYASCTDNTGCESYRRGLQAFVREYINNPVITVTPSTSVYANTEVRLGRVSASLGGCPSQGTMKWYKDGTLLQEGGALYVYPLQTTTYEGRCANFNLCEGAPTFVTILVNESCQAPVSTVSGSYTIDQGNSINLPIYFSGSVPYSFTFDNRQFTNITESPYYVTVSPQFSTEYEVTNLSNACATGASNGEIDIKVIKIISPPQISANLTSVCLGQSVILTATNCNGTVTWNNSLNGGTSKTVSPTQTTTYTAYCTKYDVNSGNSNEITVIVNPIPQISLTAENTNVNSGETVTLFAIGCEGVVTWANGLSTGASITVSPTTNTTYSATCSANDCISPSAHIDITTDCSSLLNLSGISTSNERRAVKIESSETQFLNGRNIYLSQSAVLSPPFNFQAVTGKTFETRLGGCDNTNDLMMHLSFSKNTNDISGKNNHATAHNTYSYVPGVKGNAIRIVGAGYTGLAGGYLTLPPIISSQTQNFTIALWVKEESLTSTDGEAYIWFGVDASSGKVGIGRFDNAINFMINGTSNTIKSPFNASYQGNYVHYALTCQNGTLKGFINGIKVGEINAGSAAIGSVDAGMGVHWWFNSSTRFIGSFDETRIYHRVLSNTEILYLYNAEKN